MSCLSCFSFLIGMERAYSSLFKMEELRRFHHCLSFKFGNRDPTLGFFPVLLLQIVVKTYGTRTVP